jgi:hypothetical protein
MTMGPGWFFQRIWWQFPWRHPSEDRLLALALGTTNAARKNAASASHLRTCEPCEHRFNALSTLLTAMPEVADARFDEVFTPQRLQTQRARIAYRLAQLLGRVEPARVLAFPFSSQKRRPFDVRSTRWLAGAATAGVLLGVTAGQLIHYHPFETQSATADEPADAAPQSAAALNRPTGTFDMTGTVELPPPERGNPTQASALTLVEFAQLMAEEGFLTNLDLALTSHRISEFESIDALTPRVRDLPIDIQ